MKKKIERKQESWMPNAHKIKMNEAKRMNQMKNERQCDYKSFYTSKCEIINHASGLTQLKIVHYTGNIY